MAKNMKKLLLDTEELSEVLGVGIRRTREITRMKDFPALKVGNRTKTIASQLDEWLIKNIGENL